MKILRLTVVVLFAGLIGLTFLSCGDLEKYKKPAEVPQAEPQSRSVDIKGTPEEREQGQEFAGRLEAIRAAFLTSQDTTGILADLDSLLTEADRRWTTLSENSEFGTFYLLVMADILNQISFIKQRTGDKDGAREAQRKLFEIERQLPK